MSLVDLAPHEVDVRLGDVVVLPTAPGRSLEVCVGRVMSLEDFNAHILLLSGDCVVEHVETLRLEVCGRDLLAMRELERA